MGQVKGMEREISRVYRCAARDDSECHHKVSDDVSADAKASRRLIHIDDPMETGSMEDSFLLTFVSCFSLQSHPYAASTRSLSCIRHDMRCPEWFYNFCTVLRRLHQSRQSIRPPSQFPLIWQLPWLVTVIMHTTCCDIFVETNEQDRRALT
jgi:hypothetical protein